MWAYHCLDWRLEHYLAHNCQIKQTKKEWLTNKLSISNTNFITNLTISQADKLMQTIANLKSIISDKLKENRSQQLQDL
jgi:hypothetical protein